MVKVIRVVEQCISLIFIADTNRAALGARDCSDIRSMGFTTSGVYRIYAGDDRKKMQVDVYCDFNSFKESWLVCISDINLQLILSYRNKENTFILILYFSLLEI